MATYAGAPPGSGANFEKLKGALAARGAHDPGALAGWIGRKKYGHKGMGKLSAMGRAHSHSNALGFTGSEEGGYVPGAYTHSHVVTHSHEYASLDHTHENTGGGYSPSGRMHEGMNAASGVGSLETGSSKLRTPQAGFQRSTGFQGQRLGVGARTGNYGSQSNTGQRAVSLSLPTVIPQRLPVTTPWDIVIGRASDGSAQVRHRRGGMAIGSIRQLENGAWMATSADGNVQLPEHTHQRTALMELLGTYNRGTVTPERPAIPYAQPPQQTPLMAKFGVPAISALATPTVGASDGPRVASAGGTPGGEPTDGLTPKGKTIYAKLRSRGFPAERALAFAKRAQNMGAGKFTKAAA